jgi:hypothetical protein
MSQVASQLDASPGTSRMGCRRGPNASAPAAHSARVRCRRTASAVVAEWAALSTSQSEARRALLLSMVSVNDVIEVVSLRSQRACTSRRPWPSLLLLALMPLWQTASSKGPGASSAARAG